MPKRPDPQLKIIEQSHLKAVEIQRQNTAQLVSTVLVIESRWLRVQEFLRAKALAPTTLKAYEGELRRFCNWTEKAWHQVTRRDIERYKQQLQSGYSKRGKPRSPETIRRALATLQSFFRWLVICDYIGKDPTLLVELPKGLPAVSKEFKIEEVRELRIEARGNPELQARDLAMLSVLEHGLRASEAVGLNIGNYDGERLHILEAKADSVGTVPLTQKARNTIDAYLSWLMRNGFEVTPESPLFISLSPRNKGKRLGYHGPWPALHNPCNVSQNTGRPMTLYGSYDCIRPDMNHAFLVFHNLIFKVHCLTLGTTIQCFQEACYRSFNF